MSAKYFLTLVVLLLGAAALVTGCGSDSVAPVDEAPLLPPQNVTAAAAPSGAVTVRWEASVQTNLSGYKVYRNDVQADQTVTLTAEPIAETIHEDETAAPGRQYEYRVTSVSTSGSESTYASRTIVVPARPKDRRNRGI